MIIYLDESKKIGEGRIVFGGFVSRHKHQYIQKIIQRKKLMYGFSEGLELKGTKDTGKMFYERMIKDIDFKFLQDSIIGVNAFGYDKDSLDNYQQCIVAIISKLYPKIKPYYGNVLVYADKINLGKTSEIEKHITGELNSKFPFQGKITFFLKESKKNNGVQIADLLSYQMRLCNINNEKIDSYLLQNSINLDLQEEFYIQKKT